MAIRVKHGSGGAELLPVALATGRGAAAREERERADRLALQRAQLAQRGQLSREGMALRAYELDQDRAARQSLWGLQTAEKRQQMQAAFQMENAQAEQQFQRTQEAAEAAAERNKQQFTFELDQKQQARLQQLTRGAAAVQQGIERAQQDMLTFGEGTPERTAAQSRLGEYQAQQIAIERQQNGILDNPMPKPKPQEPDIQQEAAKRVIRHPDTGGLLIMQPDGKFEYRPPEKDVAQEQAAKIASEKTKAYATMQKARVDVVKSILSMTQEVPGPRDPATGARKTEKRALYTPEQAWAMARQAVPDDAFTMPDGTPAPVEEPVEQQQGLPPDAAPQDMLPPDGAPPQEEMQPEPPDLPTLVTEWATADPALAPVAESFRRAASGIKSAQPFVDNFSATVQQPKMLPGNNDPMSFVDGTVYMITDPKTKQPRPAVFIASGQRGKGKFIAIPGG